MSSGEVVYEWSVWRSVVTNTVIGLIGGLIGGSVSSLLRGETPYSDGGLGFVLVFVVVFVVGSVILDWKRPPRVRFTGDGVELFGARRDGVFVPWAIDPDIRVRWVWLARTVRVTVPAADASHVVRLLRGGRDPALRRRDETVRISMPLYGLAVPATAFSEAARSARPASPQ